MSRLFSDVTIWAGFLVSLLMIADISTAESCNEAVCASLVTKCMLLKSCECDMTDKSNCSCCKDCHRCLHSLYTECCSCVGKAYLLLAACFNNKIVHSV